MARKEKEVYALDAETDPFEFGSVPTEFVWGLRGPDGHRYFWSDTPTLDLMEYLQDVENAVIYAHNGGKFDFFFLLPYLDPDLFIVNGRIAKATLFEGQIELRDSWMILPMPLSAHGKDDIDYNKMRRENRTKHKSEILKYLKKDCDSLYEWVTDFRHDFGSGLTLAGSAFNQLRKTEYPVEHTNDFFDDYFRPYYYGGRVQCFEVGAFDLPDMGYWDIKSAYPMAMMSPHWQGGNFRETKALPTGDNGSWFATITARSWGALPYRHEGKLYFPDDGKTRTFKAGGWEINAGLKTGTLEIEQIHSVSVPTFLADFTAYVNKFFAMKSEAEEQMNGFAPGSPEWRHWATKRQFAKFMLNACYGKFGQDGRKFEKFVVRDFGDVPDNDVYNWSFYAETEFQKTIYSRPDPARQFYNVATAASITSYVRAYLWTHINATERPLYCDTDSIIGVGFHGEIGDKVGMWEKEATLTEAYIAQRKMYALKTDDPRPEKKYKVASKGVRLSYEQIKAGVLNGKNVVTEKDAPAFSLKYGARFFTREINFQNIEKNACNNPPEQ